MPSVPEMMTGTRRGRELVVARNKREGAAGKKSVREKRSSLFP